MGKDLYIYKGERKAKGEGLEYIPIQLDKRKKTKSRMRFGVPLLLLLLSCSPVVNSSLTVKSFRRKKALSTLNRVYVFIISSAPPAPARIQPMAASSSVGSIMGHYKASIYLYPAAVYTVQ